MLITIILSLQHGGPYQRSENKIGFWVLRPKTVSYNAMPVLGIPYLQFTAHTHFHHVSSNHKAETSILNKPVPTLPATFLTRASHSAPSPGPFQHSPNDPLSSTPTGSYHIHAPPNTP